MGRGSHEPLPPFYREWTSVWKNKPETEKIFIPVKRMRSEKELLSKARRLDSSTLTEIYRRYSPGLYRYAARLLGDQDKAEDCVAEVFSRLLESLNNGGGPYQHLQAYLYQIAHNWITDQFRARPYLITNANLKLAQAKTDPVKVVHQRLELDRVRLALAQMHPDQRQVIVLKYLEGWSNQEIAETLGKSVGAVRVLHHRGVKQLKHLLRTPEKVV
jgi:RNA polymerase sigma-70 factor (ECF subfamily)